MMSNWNRPFHRGILNIKRVKETLYLGTPLWEIYPKGSKVPLGKERKDLSQQKKYWSNVCCNWMTFLWFDCSTLLYSYLSIIVYNIEKFVIELRKLFRKRLKVCNKRHIYGRDIRNRFPKFS